MDCYTKIVVSAVVLLGLFLLSGTALGAEENPETKVAGGLEGVDNETVEVVIAFEDTGGIGADSETDISVDDMKIETDRNTKAVETLADSEGGIEVKNSLWLANSVVASVDTNRTPLDRLASMDDVERIHRNFEVEVHSTKTRHGSSEGAVTPVSPENTEVSVSTESFTYGLEQINAPDVWSEFGTRGQGSKVAVLDTGMDVSHPDLDLRNEDPGNPTYPGGWAEFDSSGNQVVGSEPKDFGTHGTHVSGTVAGGNASGTAVGVAPETELMHAAVLTDCSGGGCSGTFSQIIAGAQWAVDNDADVISMSLGADGTFDSLIDPVRNAKSQGTFVVASAGNNDEGTSGSPGNVYDSLSVGASRSNRDIVTFSGGELIDTDQDWNSPPSDWPDEYVVPDVAAPGAFVKSTLPNDNYGTKSGTSMAAPHVSGAAALVISAAGEDLSPDEIRSVLEKTARKPDGWDESDAQNSIGGNDTRYGSGIIDAYSAVNSLQGTGNISGVVTDEGGNDIENASQRVGIRLIDEDEGVVRVPANDSVADIIDNDTGNGFFTPADDGSYSESVTVTGGETNYTVESYVFEEGDNKTRSRNSLCDRFVVNKNVVEDRTTTINIVLSCGISPVNGFENPPHDLNDDGLYRDVNGDNGFNLGDVIALYENYEGDPVLNNNPELFNFNNQENPDDVTLGDVIALYEER